MAHPIDQQLQAVHRQLAGLPQAEPSTREQLLILLADITRLLDDNEQHTPAEAVESLAARFEADHPDLSAALRNLINSLSNAGI
jgi:phosphoglycerate-specific signal transduction histidine kinase